MLSATKLGPIGPRAPKPGLSPQMVMALEKMVEHDRLDRWPGGFWTYPGCSTRMSSGQEIPTWYVGSSTVLALVKRGMASFTNEKWPREGAVPTEAGKETTHAT